MIQAFEFTHELAWNVLKDFFSDQGNNSITGSKDAAREGFNRGLILDGTVWMEMIKSCNLTSHTYNEKVAEDIVGKVISDYFKAFEEFKYVMKERVSQA